MNRSEYMAIKPSFLTKYARRYDAALSDPKIQAGMSEWAQRSIEEQVSDMYGKVFKSSGDTATITLSGPMSENGPDWVDIYLGYGGTAYKNLIRACDEILADDSIKKVIINVNTPGGNIDGLDAAYLALKKVVDSGREVITYNMGDIASAGVWYTSCSTRIIAATPSAMIGSIGVVIDTYDFTGFYNEMGIKEISITNTASPNKRPDITTKSGQDIWRKELDALFGVFIERVTAGRTAGAKQIESLKGEMVIAAEAVKIGLMDDIMGVTPVSQTESAKKSTKKELTMDEEVKKALEAITNGITAIGDRVGKLEAAKPKEDKSSSLSEENSTFALNIITGGKYPATVTAEAGKVLAGKSDISTLKAMTAAIDAVYEQQNGAGANAGEGEGKETVPAGKLPTGKPKDFNGILETDEEIAAELKRVRGEA